MATNIHETMTNNEDVDIQEVQRVPLRRDKTSQQSILVSITEAIRAAGLGNGGSFRFVPSSVDEIGMLVALGNEESVDGRSEQFARNIRTEGQGFETLRLVIPSEALEMIVDTDSIDWDNPPEVNVWAGDRLLAFELANPEERTVPINREQAEGDDKTSSEE
jgi:hypothetical protein